VVALFDNNPNAISSLKNVPLFIGQDGFEQWLIRQETINNIHGIAAIGGSRGNDRIRIHNLFSSHGLNISSLIHPSASVCSTSIIGCSSQLLSQSLLAADSVIGESCILNHQASIDHECVIGNGVHLAPSSTLCGCVVLGNNVMIGAGATVLPRINIGDNTVVGAGSTVTKNLPANVVVVGTPARVIKRI
jgi:sugar O-acyltransferase (sialic acid O-acetyltransferase NeuD family)